MICERYALTRGAELRARQADSEMKIEGYFAVFGARYELFDGVYETVERGAFAGETTGDVRALVNHDTTLVLGRVPAGTLILREDEKGLWGEITINPADGDAVNLYERVKRGDVTQCSFGFDIIDQDVEWTPDGRVKAWHIRKVKLYEVSVVTFPAYEETGVEARKKDAEAEKRARGQKWRAEAIRKLKGA